MVVMSVREMVQAEADAARIVRCGMCKWLEDRDDREEWEELLAESDRAVKTANIASAVRKLGGNISAGSMRHHRNGHSWTR